MPGFGVNENSRAIGLTALRAPARRTGSPSGQILVFATMALVVLMGFVALAIDVGQFRTVRRAAQTAADASAVAGAVALRMNQNVTSAARSGSALNGFTDGSQEITVTVNNPPVSGSYAGNAKYVEVIVAQPQSTNFMRVLGFKTVNVSARAVASSASSPACVYALDPGVSGALSVAGSSSMTLSCGAIVDSSSSTALTVGSGSAFTATSIGVVGGYSGSASPTPVTGIAPAVDPLSYLTPPTVGGCTAGVPKHITKTPASPLNPGVYCGGLQISAGVSVTFNPGLYILDGGGLKVSGGATLSGTGVTFYLTYDKSNPYGPVALSGSSQLNLTAPTSGAYEGILFYQDPTVPAGSLPSTITGTSTSTLNGAIYFPTTALSYSGNSSVSGYTIIVADTVTVSGHSTINDNYSSLADGSPIKSTSLYE